MTPEQALQILEQTSAEAHVPRRVHAQCIQAVEVLKKALEAKPKEDEPVKVTNLKEA